MNAPALPPQVLSFGPHHVTAQKKEAYFQKFFEGVPVGLPNYASIPKRFAAKLIDAMIMMSINVPIIALTLWMLLSNNLDFSDPVVSTRLNLAYAFLQLFGYGLNVSYTTYFHGRFGATLGKMAMGLRVVQQNGEPISYMRALGRAFAEILSALTFYIGYFMAPFSKERSALHDLICDTRVIEKQSQLPPQMRCASCNSALEPTTEAQQCPTCKAGLIFEAFPAAHSQPLIPSPKTAEHDQARCFYHSDFAATQTCAYSGRYLCELCSVPYDDLHYSGQSLWEMRKKGSNTVFAHERRLLDPIVGMVALLPFLVFPPLVVISAPLTIIFAIYAFNKPGRLLGGHKSRLIGAIALALIQILAVIALIAYVLPLYI